MQQIYWLAGPASLLSCFWLGSTVLAVLNHRKHELALSPVVGMACWTVFFSLLIVARQIAFAPYVSAVVLIATCPFARRTWLFIRSAHDRNCPLAGLMIALAALQTVIIASAWLGSNEPTVFWSIYRLTGVSPGDSPQTMMQAQYLVYGESLKRLENFGLFDRPFLGAPLTAGILCTFKLCLGDSLYPHYVNVPLDIAYTSVWIWLNAPIVIGVWLVARRYAPNRALLLTAVICASPFVVFNGIGLWPKMLALHITILGALFALEGRFRSAIALTSMAFLCHGSFLWPHFAIAGVIFLVALKKRESKVAATIIGLALIAPACWFAAEKMSGIFSPLRYYYLYDVGVNEAMHRPMQSIVSEFYRSTDLLRIMILPLANIAKMLAPTELWTAISHFQLRAKVPNFAGALFAVEQNRPIFFAGLAAGCIGVLGVINGWKRSIELRLATLCFLLMPLIPAAALYRKNDHFITVVQLTAILPFMIGITLAFSTLTRRLAASLASLVVVEYGLVYFTRNYNQIYTIACATLLVGTLAIVLSSKSEPLNAPPESDLPTSRSLDQLFAVTLLAIAIAPLVALVVLRDGGLALLLERR